MWTPFGCWWPGAVSPWISRPDLASIWQTLARSERRIKHIWPRGARAADGVGLDVESNLEPIKGGHEIFGLSAFGAAFRYRRPDCGCGRHRSCKLHLRLAAA